MPRISAGRRRAAAVALLCLLAAAGTASAFDPHVVALSFDPNGVAVDRVDPLPPFAVTPGLLAPAGEATIRHFFGRHYLVEGSQGAVEILDPNSLSSLGSIPVGAGSDPRDIVLLDPATAYVSRRGSASLLKVDPSTGAVLGAIDLGVLADQDGIPEMNMMALDGTRLFVQLQRMDRRTGERVEPSLLAVIDTTTDSLVDADPGLAGVQGIELQGTIPIHRMRVDSAARRLFVCAPGYRLEVLGGIEEIDLDGLVSLGFILPEEHAGLDLGPFVMISADEGFYVGHTDIVASSHLHRFHRNGTIGPELDVTFDTLRGIEFDPATGYLYFPDPYPNFSGGNPGVTVVDTADDTIVTPGPSQTSGHVLDVLLAAGPGPGEATDLDVVSVDPATGEMDLAYTPACGAADHTLVYGPLAQVGTYAYSGQACAIGVAGTVTGFDPGPGSYFILVVGNDGASLEGSYGLSTAGERPEDVTDPICSFTQDLSRRCDAPAAPGS